MKSQLLRLGILEVLNEIGIAPEKTILLALNGVLRLGVTYTDMRSELQKLEEAHRVVSVTDRNDIRLWDITTDGKADRSEYL